MRALGLVGLLLLTALAGCLGQEDAPASPGPGDDGPDDEGPPEAPREQGLRAPVLVPGTAFTFTTDGVYDGEEAITMVVAEASPTGYLLAGASEDDLASEIVWGRPWPGAVDRFLTPLAEDGTPGNVRLAFPLWDGKTWAFGEGTATARVAQVPTPSGTELGFEVTTQGLSWNETVTYAASVGFITSYRTEARGVVWGSLVLTEVSTSDTWVWYERLQRYETQEPPTPVWLDVQQFQPPEAADGIVVSAGGTEGARITVQPSPAGGEGPWAFEVTGGEEWATMVFASAPGVWSFSTSQPNEGYAWAAIEAVRWLGNGADTP